MHRVLVNKPIHQAALDRLGETVELLTPFEASEDELLELLPEIDGLVLCSGLTMGAEEMDLACNLQIIARHGVGVDIVDVEAATERGLPVTYTPDGPTESTAEHAFMLILAAARRVTQLDQAVRTGDFAIRDHFRGQELEGKSLGVIGFGRIGKRTAAMCRDALNMSVYVYDPYVDEDDVVAWGATHVDDVKHMVGSVDVVSIHTPLTPSTKHLVSRDVIGAMKPGAVIVNTSRGPVVDEEALVEALSDGKLHAAGLDVFDPQPPLESSPLLALENTILTPHVGSATDDGRKRMGFMAVDDTLRVLRGERPLNLVNPAVWTSQ